MTGGMMCLVGVRDEPEILTESLNLMHVHMQDGCDTNIAIGEPSPIDNMLFISKTGSSRISVGHLRSEKLR